MNLARTYYEEFHRINPPTLGPYIDFTRLSILQQKQLLSLKQKINSESLFQENINLINLKEINLPSPWHTWIFLTNLHLKLLKPKDPFWDIANNLIDEHQIIVPVYRGHHSSDFKPSPSLYRQETNRDFEEKSFNAFSFLLGQKFLWQNLDFEPSSDTITAFAQHYSIKTKFLDITADPAIAIYFANNAKKQHPDSMSSVLVFDLNSTLASSSKLTLPPPLMERLYQQKGSFLSSNQNIDFTDEVLLKINFPAKAGFYLFEDGKQLEPLTPNKWLEEAVKWAQNRAHLNISIPSNQIEINNLLYETFEEIGYPIFCRNDPALNLIGWLEQFENMLYWYAIRIIGTNEYILIDIAKNIAKNNPSIVKLAIKLHEIQNKTNHKQSRFQKFWNYVLNELN